MGHWHSRLKEARQRQKTSYFPPSQPQTHPRAQAFILRPNVWKKDWSLVTYRNSFQSSSNEL